MQTRQEILLITLILSGEIFGTRPPTCGLLCDVYGCALLLLYFRCCRDALLLYAAAFAAVRDML